MKKVFLEIPDDAIALKDVTSGKYYGILMITNNKRKAFISANVLMPYKPNNKIPQIRVYQVMCLDALTTGNGWSKYSDEDLKMCIEKCISDENIVYEFDTYMQLFNWLLN